MVQLGYNSVSPFVIELTNFNNSNFSQGLISKFPLVVPENSSIQTEGLTTNIYGCHPPPSLWI